MFLAELHVSVQETQLGQLTSVCVMCIEGGLRNRSCCAASEQHVCVEQRHRQVDICV